MDQRQENKNKAKNWLHRFLRIRSHFHERSSPANVDLEVDTKSQHRNSFRKRLRKVQSRVKSCMFPQEMNTSKRPFSVPVDLPSTSRRIPDIPPPPLPERPRILQQSPERSYAPLVREGPHRIPTDEIVSLTNCYWYWGPMATAEAEAKLEFKPDGTFLVRDSSSTSYLFSISFRSVGKTMHARIEYNRGKYNLCGTYAQGFPTVTELIHDAMKTSENGIYCYSRRGEYPCEFPVRLTKPISRYTEVPSLKHLCKVVIRQCTNINGIPKLPLPTMLHTYLLEKPYF